MCFQQMAKFEQGRCIQCFFTIPVNTDKTAYRLTVVKRIFRRLIRKTESLLGNIHTQSLRPEWRAT